MLLALIALILLPLIVFILAHKVRPNNLWAMTGVAFGIVVYPFFAALTIPLLYAGRLGFAILSMTNPLAVLHRFPGKVLYQIIEGHAFRDEFSFLLIALNAIIWGIIYGWIGWYIDQNSVVKNTKGRIEIKRDIQITWEIVVRIWWSIVWRVMLLNVMLTYLLVNLPLGRPSERFAITTALGIILPLLFSIYSVKKTLTLKWDNFHIKVQSNDEPA